jgi:hypothetical protein
MKGREKETHSKLYILAPPPSLSKYFIAPLLDFVDVYKEQLFHIKVFKLNTFYVLVS